MADHRAECQRYLTEFRVIELKELLKLIGIPQRGRKSELFQRANELLIRGSPKIQQYIRQVYEKSRKVKQRPARYSYGGKVMLSQQYSDMKGMMQHHTPKSQFSSPVPVKGSNEKSYIPHPDVKFKQHPFYSPMDVIIRPTTLLSTAVTSNGSNSMRLQFHLSPQQVQKIVSSRTSQRMYGTQVLLRFARNECSCEQEDFFPRQCYVKVNNNYCTLPGYNPVLSQRPDYKRTGAPVNITNLVKTSASQTNDVIFYWTDDALYSQGFCVEITLVRSLSASDLLQELKSKGIRSPDVTRALVREKLAVDRDSEISATSLRVSLLCPLGKLRMTHPCRSHWCKHLQCFDASIYLQMNERKARWVCPVCDKQAPADSLEVDGLFKEICEESSSNDIEFDSSGCWFPISSKDGIVSLTPDRKLVTLDNLSPVTISDTVDSASPAPVLDSSRDEGSMTNPIVIGDDDDEEDIETVAKESPFPPSTTMSTTSSTPHIISLPCSSTDHHCDSHDQALHEGGSSNRSVIVKRRFSSTTTEGGAETSHECCNSLAASAISITTISAADRHLHTTTTTTATPLPVPVITEYAPSLPYLGAPLLPYLAQQSIPTVIASSDNPAVSSSGGDHYNVNDGQHLPTLNLDESIFPFIRHSATNGVVGPGITLIND